jgi:hypothetical protein
MTTRKAPAAASVEASRYSSCCFLPQSAAGHRIRCAESSGTDLRRVVLELARGANNFNGILHAIGLPMPQTFVWVTIVTDIVGGFCLVLGAFLWSEFLLSFAAVLFLAAAMIWLK